MTKFHRECKHRKSPTSDTTNCNGTDHEKRRSTRNRKREREKSFARDDGCEERITGDDNELKNGDELGGRTIPDLKRGRENDGGCEVKPALIEPNNGKGTREIRRKREGDGGDVCYEKKRPASMPPKKERLPKWVENPAELVIFLKRKEKKLVRNKYGGALRWIKNRKRFPSTAEITSLSDRFKIDRKHLVDWIYIIKKDFRIYEKNVTIISKEKDLTKLPRFPYWFGNGHLHQFLKQDKTSISSSKNKKRENVDEQEETTISHLRNDEKDDGSDRCGGLEAGTLEEHKEILIKKLRNGNNEHIVTWCFKNIDNLYPSSSDYEELTKKTERSRKAVRDYVTYFRTHKLFGIVESSRNRSFDFDGKVLKRERERAMKRRQNKDYGPVLKWCFANIDSLCPSESDVDMLAKETKRSKKEVQRVIYSFTMKQLPALIGKCKKSVSYHERLHPTESTLGTESDDEDKDDFIAGPEGDAKADSVNVGNALGPSFVNKYEPEKCRSAFPPSSPRHLVFDNELVTLSVGPSTVPNAGSGLFLTHLGPSPTWTASPHADLGKYAPHRPRDIKSRTVMEMKNFLFAHVPAAWSHAGPERTDGCRALFDEDVEQHVIYDITSDGNAEVHEAAEATLLPYVNENGGDGRQNNVYAEHGADGSLHYILKEGFTFWKGVMCELFTDYGKEYEGVRRLKEYTTRSVGKEAGKVDRLCSNCRRNGPKKRCDNVVGYCGIYKSICEYTEEDVMAVLDYLANSPPEKSDAGWRMKWAVELLKKYCTEKLYTGKKEGIPLDLVGKMDNVLSLFPRIGNQEDLEVMKVGQYLGRQVMIENNSGYVGGMVERVVEDGDGSKYLVVMFDGEKPILTEEEVEDVLFYGGFGLSC